MLLLLRDANASIYTRGWDAALAFDVTAEEISKKLGIRPSELLFISFVRRAHLYLYTHTHSHIYIYTHVNNIFFSSAGEHTHKHTYDDEDDGHKLILGF